MKKVKSAAIDAVGYDAAKGDLHVEFRGGKTYVYHGVDAKTAAAVEGASSVRRTLTELVIGKHEATKLGGNP